MRNPTEPTAHRPPRAHSGKEQQPVLGQSTPRNVCGVQSGGGRCDTTRHGQHGLPQSHPALDRQLFSSHTPQPTNRVGAARVVWAHGIHFFVHPAAELSNREHKVLAVSVATGLHLTGAPNRRR